MKRSLSNAQIEKGGSADIRKFFCVGNKHNECNDSVETAEPEKATQGTSESEAQASCSNEDAQSRPSVAVSNESINKVC